jgi:GTP pyrophosphokinase
MPSDTPNRASHEGTGSSPPGAGVRAGGEPRSGDRGGEHGAGGDTDRSGQDAPSESDVSGIEQRIVIPSDGDPAAATAVRPFPRPGWPYPFASDPPLDGLPPFEELIADVELLAENRDLLFRAFVAGAWFHRRARRASGEPYFIHCIEVARLVAEMCPEGEAIAAALLHDTVEDTEYTLEDVRRDFSDAIAELVDGVTKLKDLSTEKKKLAEAPGVFPTVPVLPATTTSSFITIVSNQQAAANAADKKAQTTFGTSRTQEETYQKMLIATGRDSRVIVIKLCDRLHNMETLGALPPLKRKRIAHETLEIYAPIAHMLGMARLRADLEDSAMRELYPEEYRDLVKRLARKRQQRERVVESMMRHVAELIETAGIKNATVVGRPKHLYSIWQKMKRRDMSFEQLFDLIALRVIVPTVPDCYQVLGILHGEFDPIPGRIHDYISRPKDNGYRSLHTSLVGEAGEQIEIQIRTHEMHHEAEEGIAAHWKYKYRRGQKFEQNDFDAKLKSLKRMRETIGTIEPGEVKETLTKDLFRDTIFVSTPLGQRIELPEGATPIDFAFYVHTDLGLHCAGARVDGRFLSITERLRSGSVIEIIQKKSAHPTHEWLDHVVTHKAKSRIRQWLKHEKHDDNVQLGRAKMVQAIKGSGLTILAHDLDAALEPVVEAAGTLQSVEALCAEIGFGSRKAADVVQRLKQLRRHEQERDHPDHDQALEELEKTRTAQFDQLAPVVVDGLDGMVYKIARCCSPIEGEPIIGFITRGRGMSIHSATCQQVARYRKDPDNADRIIPAAWPTKAPTRVRKRLEITCRDRGGLLADVTQIMKEDHVFIVKMATGERVGNTVKLDLTIAIAETDDFGKTKRRLERTEGVLSVQFVGDYVTRAMGASGVVIGGAGAPKKNASAAPAAPVKTGVLGVVKKSKATRGEGSGKNGRGENVAKGKGRSNGKGSGK